MNPRLPAERPIDRLAYPSLLEAAEATQVVERRRAATVDGPPSVDGLLPADTLGVGLSGGGVRSATFALGVFQALAAAKALGQVDFLSTVSGGGYFGSFLGRLFTREWVRGVHDAEALLLGEDTPSTEVENRAGWGARVFRWLRENGRYLAPRGSGDVLLLGAILLRNWVAVQLVLIVTVLTGFLGLQGVREGIEYVGLPRIDQGATLLWWSPWIALPLLPFLLFAVPYGWAYWLVSRERTRIAQLSPRVGAFALLLLAAAGAVQYRDALSGAAHVARFWTCAGVGLVAVLALLYYRRAVGTTDPNAFGEPLTDGEADNFARMRLSKQLSFWLQVTGALAVLGVVDTIGQTLYAVLREGALATWGASVAAVFASIGAFARPVSMLLAPKKSTDRPGMSASTLMWIAALVVGGVWLVGVDVASHAVRWGFHDPCGVPEGIAPTVACDPATRLTATWFLLASAFVVGGFTFVFGQTRIFANLSSVQTFYAARLVRTFLGASNRHRLRNTTAVSDTIKGDDMSGDLYWQWPAREPRGTAVPPLQPPPLQPWQKGGPLHIINTTVNETVDARSGIQNQDRKGTGLAVGPRGLSLGIRHHLVSSDAGWAVFPPADQSRHSVWKADSKQAPEPLSLGRWMSVSGAAFSAAAGANTTVPMALLAGMFNVRLGYWWDSGVESERESWLERMLPVQSALAAEMLARTRGTAGRLWNLSDGGHFENMAGYELIRRRLPVIVIVDAEADPDYTFEGLAGLVRKARLDFQAEIIFLNAFELDGLRADGSPGDSSPGPVTQEVRPYFGDLDSLRRGVWRSEKLTDVKGAPSRRFVMDVERTRPSKAHAALARVTYGDPNDPQAPRSWLVYVKATLMGDEPEDVLQYHSSHPDFPQEPTSDQFFDEAQWESYRRLGQHVGHRALAPSLLAYLKQNPPGLRT